MLATRADTTSLSDSEPAPDIRPITPAPSTLRPTPTQPVPATPAPSQKAASEQGTLIIRSSPSGARITINGEASGLLTPTTVDMSPGAYDIQLTRDGYEPLHRSIVIRNQEMVEVPFSLSPLMGTLGITVRPWGILSVNGEVVQDNISFRQEIPLPATRHLIRIEHPQLGRVWEQYFQVQPGETPTPLMVNFNEKSRVTIEARNADNDIIAGDLYVNNQLVGPTPQQLDLSIGLHTIEVRSGNFSQVRLEGNANIRSNTLINLTGSQQSTRVTVMMATSTP